MGRRGRGDVLGLGREGNWRERRERRRDIAEGKG